MLAEGRGTGSDVSASDKNKLYKSIQALPVRAGYVAGIILKSHWRDAVELFRYEIVFIRNSTYLTSFANKMLRATGEI